MIAIPLLLLSSILLLSSLQLKGRTKLAAHAGGASLLLIGSTAGLTELLSLI